MSERDSISVNRALFNLGARLGSLEGYLYAEEKVGKHYLPGWIENIQREFGGLPDETREGIARDYTEVWRKVEALVVELYGDQDSIALQVKEILKKA